MVYSAIDIGSDTIKIVVGKVENDQVNILGATKTRSVGIKKGLIVDKELAKESINLALDELEKQLGFRVDKAIIAVPFYDVSVNAYNGMCYPDGEIKGDDVITCFKSSVSTVDIDLEVITVFPIDFLINGEKQVLDPKGEQGEKLESRLLISTVPKNNIYSYLEVLEMCGIDVVDLSFGPINDFYNMANKADLSKISGAVVDIGKDKTEVAIFNKGLMISGQTINVGSRQVDNDIAYIYHLDKKTVRDIKENFACASSQYASDVEEIEYETDNEEKIKINQVEVSKVMEARLEEILKNVKKAINDLTKHQISYIIITGGVSNSPGFDYLIQNVFGDIAYSVNMNLIGVRDNVYTSCVGMLKYYYDKLKIRGTDYTMYDDIPSLLKEKKNVVQEKIIDDMKKYLEDN